MAGKHRVGVVSGALPTLMAALVLLIAIPAGPAAGEAGAIDLKWHKIGTPGYLPSRNDIVSPSDITRFAATGDGKSICAVDTANRDISSGRQAIYRSSDYGVSWSDAPGMYLFQSMNAAEKINFRAWDVALAPDDPLIIAVVAGRAGSDLPGDVWYTNDGGLTWKDLACPTTANISSISISCNATGRFIAIGTRTGTGGGSVSTRSLDTMGAWKLQNLGGDVLSIRFSPNYSEDLSLACLYSTDKGTYYNVGLHDPDLNTIDWSAVYINSPPCLGTGGISPTAAQVISADLSFPFDYNGQAPALNRCYISIDDAGVSGTAGIYRLDYNVPYRIFKSTPAKRIAGIAYYGTYACGKLLAGEVLGQPCTATVNSWFTDAPVTCPDTCWYSALKLATGAAGSDNCSGSGIGNARVAWQAGGDVACLFTCSSAAPVAGPNWPVPFRTGRNLDESAFSVSRDNGKTWNQLSLIDTQISTFTDIAPSPDSSTVFLASVNRGTRYRGFDSLWRSTGPPDYTRWERVLCALTTDSSCAKNQTDLAILRMPSDSPGGEYIAWCAAGTRNILTSSDSGQTWRQVKPNRIACDLAWESRATMYVLDPNGTVQKLTSNGSAWSCGQLMVSGLSSGCSIATALTAATPDNDGGCIVVAGCGDGETDVAYSVDGGKNFKIIAMQLPVRGNTIVLCSSSFKSDGTILAINRGGMFSWGIYTGQNSWEEWWGEAGYPSPVTCIATARNYSLYFTTPATWGQAIPYIRWCSATSGLDPAVSFGDPAIPTTRLRVSGGTFYGEPILVWAIDQRAYSSSNGGLWLYADTLSWNGPSIISPSSQAAVSYDTVTGRAGQVDLRWKPVSLSRGYEIQIAADADFTLLMATIGGGYSGPNYYPSDYNSPALFIPPGGGKVTDSRGNSWNAPGLEAGHVYYWRVSVKDVLTGDAITSPQSSRESFSVRPGFPVKSRY